MSPALSALLLALPALAQDDPLPEPQQTARSEARAFWRDASEALGQRLSVAQVHPPDPSEVALRSVLGRTSLPALAVHDQESLEAIIELVGAQTGLPLIVDPRAENACYDEGVVFNLRFSNPVAVDDALDVLTELAGEEVAWTIKGGVVLVTTTERAHANRVMHLHPVADLVPFFEVEDVATMIQETVSPGSWEWDGVAIEPRGPFIVITHHVPVQLGTEAFLGDLRRFIATLDGRPSFSPSAAEHERDAALARLESVSITPQFDDAPIGDAAAFLQQVTGMNFLVSTAVFDELDEEETSVDLRLPEMSVRALLDVIVETSPEMSWSIVDGIVRIQTAEELRGDIVLALYDVRDICHMAPIEFSMARARYGDDELEPRVIDESLLEDLIRNNIAPDSWDMNPANSLRISSSGLLVVHQAPAVHGEIRALLQDLQAIADVLIEVEAQHSRGR